MLEVVVTLIALLGIVVPVIGVTSAALLLLLYGPGAAAAFAAGVSTSRLGADPLLAIGIAFVTFYLVTAMVGVLLRTTIRGAQTVFAR